MNIDVAGMKKLACAVLNKAVEDIHAGPAQKEPWKTYYQSAKEFLCTENPELEFWCGLAGLNVPAVVEKSLEFIAGDL